jgi:chromate reductase, NAD(P)H dehydrogenase (quinone)
MIRLLAVSGSLRQESSNSRLIRRLAAVAEGIEIDVFCDLHRLPHFNPDHEPSDDPVVLDWTERMLVADGFIVSTPEYAHGVPGSLKNALDWLVGTPAFIEKPFALFQASDRSVYAPRSLVEILNTMSGRHVVGADVTIDLRRRDDLAESILAMEESGERMRRALEVMVGFIQAVGNRG